MPGAKAKHITTDMTTIQDLQVEVSKWHTHLSGVHVGSDWEEFLGHITGLGHLEIFKLAEYKNYDSTSSKAVFERAVGALNSSLVSLHKSQDNKILMKEDLLVQQAGVKKYAQDAKKMIDDFDHKWDVRHLPNEVQSAYNKVAALAH